MAGRRLALVVACDRYEDAAFGRLVSPGQDALALERALADPAVGGFEVRRVTDPLCHVLHREIEQFFSEGHRDDLVLLYISSHGVKDEEGRLLFATTDTRRSLLLSSAVSAHFVNECMRRCRAGQQVLLLDCCYSGAFPQGLAAKSDRTLMVGDHFEARGRVVITASS